MYSKKFERFIFGVCTRCLTSAVNGTTTSARTAVSWTSVRKHHKQFLERRSQNGFAVVRIRHASKTTVDPNEVKRFQLLATKWWNEQGDFAALHSMNDLRVPFIRDNLLNAHGGRQPGKPLAGLRILDVGCGGGLLTEPLGRLGADVLGIDPVADSIGTAEVHAWHDPDLRGNVRYRAITLEELSEKGGKGAGQFDAVVASEVVEHLADLETFTLCCNQVLKPGGSLFITTINKTQLSYALAIVAAEEMLRIVPSGTHDWDKFVSPVELERLLESNGFHVESIRGMLYNPLSRAWSWTESTSINYALHAVKLEEEPNPDEDDPEDPTVIVAQAKARRWYN
ncbi:ubiquinone biosynthesis O-methyltransferase, mitochondrial [Oncorhynchus masou masou]|uniref:ubiquinone biosynthesis O-methyltransferase, mitochondrial n=1 Tax=Oncorhynchus masou masou TaxID=90313 RepID=UPI0031838AC7